MNCDRMIVVGIDASNISSGGGLTHLKHLINAAKPMESSIERIVIWASSKTSAQFPQRHDWLRVVTPNWCDGGWFRRIFGQQLYLSKELTAAGCDVLFSPGGTLPLRCKVPMVTMSQNMLPFEPSRALLFGPVSVMRVKMALLRINQGRSFRNAEGVIFLTNYAQQVITKSLGGIAAQTMQIPHGIESRFMLAPRPQRTPESCLVSKRPLRLLYVSIQMPYKHQLEVLQAVNQLHQKGMPVELLLVGASWGQYGKSVRKLAFDLDPEGNFIKNLGSIPFEKLHVLYREADLFLFASSCENLPNILIEAMAAGLPVLSSDRGPMVEILGDAGCYFNPEEVGSIVKAIELVVNDDARRAKMAQEAWLKAQQYSWEKCARNTFNFIAQVMSKNGSSNYV